MKPLPRRRFLQTAVLALPVITGSCRLTPGRGRRQDGFVELHDGRLHQGGRPYYFVGANYPGATALGSPSVAGGLARLRRELDHLQRFGITNLRILAASEGTHPQAITKAPGQWDEGQLRGLDFLLAEMAQRNLRGVLYLTNYWEWSGGMAQYVSWATGEPLPEPAARMRYAARFYLLPAAREMHRAAMTHLVKRRNTVTGVFYANDPTIMSWQICNEPRPGPDEPASEPTIPHYVEWLDHSARLLKELAPRQMVSTGSEGIIGSLGSEAVYLAAHRSAAIDYLTLHVWVKNWNWLTEFRLGPQYEAAAARALAHVEQHIRLAEKAGKPLIMEEFGIPRDDESLVASGATHMRDDYFFRMFGLVTASQKAGGRLQGANFWAWEERRETGANARLDVNAVMASDRSTMEVTARHAKALLTAA